MGCRQGFVARSGMGSTVSDSQQIRWETRCSAVLSIGRRCRSRPAGSLGVRDDGRLPPDIRERIARLGRGALGHVDDGEWDA